MRHGNRDTGIGDGGKEAMIDKIKSKIVERGLDVPEFYYLLGVLFGDGFFTKFDKKGKPHEIRLNVTDKKFADEFEKAVKALGGNYTRHLYKQTHRALGRKPIHRVVVFSIKNIHIYELYDDIYAPLRSKPVMLINLLDSAEKIASFVKGLYESEGCFFIGGKRPKWQIQFTSSDEQLLIVLKELLSKLGFEFHLSKAYSSKISSKPFWHLRKSGRISTLDVALKFFEIIKPAIKNMADVFERRRR